MPTMRILSLLCALYALCGGAPAQTLDPIWNGPERLSSYEGTVGDKTIAADSRGRSHAFWIEDRLFEGVLRLQYARFGGQTWTHTVAIEDLSDPFAGALTAVDAAIDGSDVIHLISHGRAGALVYRSVPVDRALSPSAWSEPVVIPVRAVKSELLVDVGGALVVVYAGIDLAGPSLRYGLFSVRSADGGKTWSEPVQIDSGVPERWLIQDVDADYDGSTAVHAAWTYVFEGGYEVRAIKHARSLDGGATWSAPAILEEVGLGDEQYSMRLAVPAVRASGPEAHIVYAGGGAAGVGRRHSISRDHGATWSRPTAIWGGLEGAAGTDAALYDSQGRFHLLAQVRFPQGIYHSVWDGAAWSQPSLLYLISTDSLDVIGDRVHAQWFEASIAQDDRIVLLMETCAAGCQDNSTWPQNPILFALSSVTAPGSLPELISVSSATFVGGAPLAPAQIAAGFGATLHDKTVLASQTPLPSTLDGVSVEVVDILNQRRPAALQFVSPQQVNYVIPEESALGLARIRVRRNGKPISGGTVMLNHVAPSIFTVNGQGTGVAAATWLSVAPGGERSAGLVFDPSTGLAVPIDFDPSKGQLYLTLYGTGIRGFRNNARAEVGGVAVPILSIGAQGQYEGLDQINVGPLPKELAAGGAMNVVLTVDGVQANPAGVRIRTTAAAQALSTP